MTYKKLLFYSCIYFSSIFADNHETNVVGKVLSSVDAIPLQGANVIFVNGDEEYGATTDESGIYSISDIAPGNYDVTISFIGFDDFKEDILIEAGKKYNIDAELIIQPIVMAKLEIISDANIPYKSLPGAATVLDMETIKLVNPIGTQEMLEYIPGVNGYSDDGIGNSRISVGIRGLNPRRSSRVLILEDGVPIQPALYVYPNMYYNPPADRIDRIEVIKGSGAIKYGPQTMGGVINYFTRRPRNDFGGMMRLTAGENGYASAFIETGGWGNTKLKPEIQFLLKRGDGYRDNNSFEQVNGTLKLNYTSSQNKNLYIKTNFNYENSNATYTGLTQWSFDNNPKFNPKEDDNFKVFRTGFDIIETERISSKLSQTTTAFASFFDRRWWRENDIFILAADINNQNPTAQPYYSSGNLIRTGNGQDNFGILRTFYVLGLEKSYSLRHKLFGFNSTTELGARLYWERFIDDKKTGAMPDSREGIYFIPAASEEESPEIVGQSHHYETTALSAFVSESIEMGSLTLRPGVRLEIFEQERVDRLAGSIYQDKTIFVALPGVGFIKSFSGMSLFGGIHRGFTPPSSGALKIVNFGMNIEENGLDLEAEQSWNKEIGVRGEFSILDYELAGYHIDINNLVAAGRGTAFKNLGKVITQGLEFRALINLSSLIGLLPNIHIAYSFLDTEVIDGVIVSNVSGTYGSEVSIKGKELPYSPQNTLTVGMESNLIENVSIRMDFRYVSKVYTDFENITFTDNIGVTGPVPSYNLINLSANYQISDTIQLFLSGKNITDNIYIGSRLHSNPGQKNANISSGIIPGARRQINIGINYTF
tara:strand:+ start:402 stop:2867 length:2466 start_codon:yes stop_codon:yes gene_type:complete